MGKLRERMERDLEIRGFSPNSRKAYLYWIKALARHFGRSPDQLSPGDIQRYQLYVTRERKVAWSTYNQAVSALRFFYGVTLGKDWAIKEIPYARWRDYNPEDTVRFYALRMREVGLIERKPEEVISQNADWSHLESLRQELALKW